MWWLRLEARRGKGRHTAAKVGLVNVLEVAQRAGVEDMLAEPNMGWYIRAVDNRIGESVGAAIESKKHDMQ